jgi:hypothetical protein
MAGEHLSHTTRRKDTMATNKPKSTGRTLWDLVSELVAQKSILIALAIIGWVLLAGLGYLWFVGKIGLVAAAATNNQGQGSPYLHWWSFETSMPLAECESFIREIYVMTAPVSTEDPVIDANSIGQIGVAGPVVLAIICVRTGDKTAILITAAGPEQSGALNRAAQLRDAVRAKLRI